MCVWGLMMLGWALQITVAVSNIHMSVKVLEQRMNIISSKPEKDADGTTKAEAP